MPDQPDNLISLPRKGEPAAPGGAATQSPAAGRQRRAGDSTITAVAFLDRVHDLNQLDSMDARISHMDTDELEEHRVNQIGELARQLERACWAGQAPPARMHDLFSELAARALQGALETNTITGTSA